MPDKKKRQPIVFPGHTKLSGDRHEESGVGLKARDVEPPDGGWDSTYVPGYSDMKHMNEILKLRKQKPLDMPANVIWVPRDYRGFMPYQKKGYAIITDAKLDETGTKRSEMLEQHGWEVAPAARVMPDGTIQKDDLVLAYVPGDRHRAEVRKDEEYRKFREGGPMETEHEEKIKVSDEEVYFEK